MTVTRDRAGGEVIRFATGQLPLGYLLVASSPEGVVAILIGDSPEHLVRELQERFAREQILEGDATDERRLAQVVGFIATPESRLDLPLDVRGTPFQRRVWQALCELPPGRTISYTELAARIGSPQSVRAVAGACAANNIAIAIPCHRVVRNNGALSGYAWGIERKRRLIEREAAALRRDVQPSATVAVT